MAATQTGASGVRTYEGAQAGPAKMWTWTETKLFSKTSEFYVWVISVAAVLIWGMRDAGDSFTSEEGFMLAAGLSAAYMVSRGLAKSGSREPYSIDAYSERR